MTSNNNYAVKSLGESSTSSQRGGSTEHEKNKFYPSFVPSPPSFVPSQYNNTPYWGIKNQLKKMSDTIKLERQG